ncbi:MAG: DUF1015 domain-containing protein [Candidatus Aminicenantes bacterium]|nr:DUF1015 domain-containing protein [Candidatus Aminicenantes bacterium]
MARIEPFKGIRPKKEFATRIAAPPYDVLNSKEAKIVTKKNELSFLRITKPEVDLPDGIALDSDQVYEKARENFAAFLNDGILMRDEKKNFYLYKQVWGDHVQVGLVAGASARDYQDDVIKKHEFTRPDKEQDRMRHIEVLNANTGPVFLTFKQNDVITGLFEQALKKEPEYDFVSDKDVRHIFYLVDDDDLITKIKAEFSKIEYLYVADGHHRSAAGTNIKIKREKENKNHTGDEEYNFFLSVIFPHNQMKILPYNRVVKDIKGMCKAEFFLKVSEKFTYEETETKTPERYHEFCLYIDGKWYLLKAKPGSFAEPDPVAALDAAILQNNLLGPVLGIENPRTDKRIDFVGGIRGTGELERLVDKEGYKVAFSLSPTTIEQLFKVADSGNVMPPKSTWFEPKLASGLMIHSLED